MSSHHIDGIRRFQAEIGYTVRHGKCPVCRVRPSGVWPDGVRRTTCGDPVCYRRWLRSTRADSDGVLLPTD